MAQGEIIELVIIGGSSGSLDAILKILPKLSSSFNIPIVIVMHRNVASDSVLEEVLASRTLLKVKEAEEKELITPGYIYIAPPDYHLLIEKDHTLSLDYSEKVNYSRPSIDVSFESAAEIYREKLVCIILSGANGDGAEAVAYATEVGSKIIIQDPREAIVSFMPEQAIEHTSINNIYSIQEIISFLNSL
ncbi:MAG TPA: chemotaxis protein CheB [Ferruginibacter sp.]|jgi:two-component system chemotaxis response regulator CheB|nr:chemotaxis protein CheB [Ferruginibacter sp.]